jgi:C-terminal processing protease CtpA/Prc
MNKLILLFCILVLPLSVSFAANPSMKFGGVGIDGVPQASGEIVVGQLVAGGPAHLAGIRIGDVITRIDGKPVKGADFKYVVERMLRGKAGTKVRLTVRRSGQTEPLSFVVTRRELIVPGR